MSMSYSSKDVDLVIGGTLIKEFESIEITKNPEWEHDHSNTGSITRIQQADYKYTEVTVNLKQSAADNAILSAYYVAGAYLPVMIRDKNGNTNFAAAQMSLEMPDTSTFAKSEITDLTWTLKGNYTLYFLGGN